MTTETTAATRRAVVYCRVSSLKQEKEGQSLEGQEEACHAYALANGYLVTEVYRETHTGGEFWERTELQRLCDAMRAGAFDVLLVADTDRLSREQNHIGTMMTYAERDGVEIETASEGKIENTAVGKVINSVRAFAAEIERERKRADSLRGKKQRIGSGKLHNHGRELYGYQRDRSGAKPKDNKGTRTVVEAEAIVVRQIFDALAQGVSLRRIVKRLYEEGIPSPSGRPTWGTAQLHRLARNAAYRGETVLWRFKNAKRNGHLRKDIRPEDEWVRLGDGVTPAIVNDAIWQAVQARFANNAGATTRNELRPFLLRGMVNCAVCGRRMYASIDRGRFTYRCCRRTPTDTRTCAGRRAAGQELEEWVWSEVVRVLRRPDLIAAELARRVKSGADTATTNQRASLEKDIRATERQQSKAMASITDSDDAEFARQMKERWTTLQGERDRLEAEVEAMDDRANAERLALAQMDSLKDYCSRVAANLDGFGFAERRLALEALAIRVVVNGRDWRLEGSIPAPVSDDSSRPSWW